MNAEERLKIFIYFYNEHSICLLDSDFIEIENILSLQQSESVLKEWEA